VHDGCAGGLHDEILLELVDRIERLVGGIDIGIPDDQ